MARNRQRSKQRQAERRARRLQQQGADVPPDLGGPAVDPELAVGAPPEEEGRTDFVLEGEEGLLEREEELLHGEDASAPVSEEEALDEAEDWEAAEGWERAEDFAEDDLVDDAATRGGGEAGYAVRGRRGREAHEAHRERGRVVQFLVAVWAELQRVQWPNRQALVTLTGVVLGFVLIAGGYLGLLDAIFSKLIQAIL
jgi:preprotein translocase subunit SecE